jgi:hypothetical protein
MIPLPLCCGTVLCTIEHKDGQVKLITEDMLLAWLMSEQEWKQVRPFVPCIGARVAYVPESFMTNFSDN